MWFSKVSPRRQAVRADAAEMHSLRKREPWRLGPAALIAGVFFVLATAIFFYPSDSVPYRTGQRAPTDLRSPVSFTVADPVETQRLRLAMKANPAAVLTPDPLAFDRLQSQLMNLPEDVRSVASPERIPADLAARWPHLGASSLAWLHTVSPQVYAGEVRAFQASLAGVPVVDAATAGRIAQQQSDLVYLARDGGGENGSAFATIGRNQVIGLGPKADAAQHRVLLRWAEDAFPHELASTIVDHVLAGGTATYTLNLKLTEQLAARNAAAVQANVIAIQANEPIVMRGQEITSDLHRRLQAAQERYQSVLAADHPWAWLLARMGQAMTVLLVTLVGALYVTQMHAKLNTAGRGWALVGLLLVTMFIAKGAMSAGLTHAVYLVGIGPILLTTIILLIAYNQRFALVVSCLHALLITLALGQGAEFFLTALTGITVFTFGLKEIRTRGKLIEMGVFAAAALMVSVWAIGMARLLEPAWSIGTLAYNDVDMHIEALALHSLWAALAGVAVGFITLGILPFVERMFKITTAMTLLELCDLNQPLLKRLAQEAPGTFNHSLVLGTLAEAAGDAVGANGLLCRVGAYYHDIGKLSKPQYFIENQSGGPNRHEKLSPAMSLLIIVGHVKDGIELAREYNLPWIVHQFIGQHHGTTLVEYFFHAARQRQAKAEGVDLEDVSVADTEFRYPGPRPQTREAAILMICDGAESMVRSLAEPTPGRIEAIIHKLVMKRLMDGQFAECDLTLRDLGQIEQALSYTLAGVYHGRVAYPKPLSISKQTA
jgi:putative nucleotidyltransferase with HDIG domain